MNSESGNRYSVDELTERNRPPELPALSTPTQPTAEDWTLLQEAAEYILSLEPCPSPETWQRMMLTLAELRDQVKTVRAGMHTLPTQEQQTELIRELRQIREMLQPAGRKSARISSPRYSAEDLWEFTKKLLLVILIVLVITVALSGLLWGFFTVWRTFKTLHP